MRVLSRLDSSLNKDELARNVAYAVARVEEQLNLCGETTNRCLPDIRIITYYYLLLCRKCILKT